MVLVISVCNVLFNCRPSAECRDIGEYCKQDYYRQDKAYGNENSGSKQIIFQHDEKSCSDYGNNVSLQIEGYEVKRVFKYLLKLKIKGDHLQINIKTHYKVNEGNEDGENIEEQVHSSKGSVCVIRDDIVYEKENKSNIYNAEKGCLLPVLFYSVPICAPYEVTVASRGVTAYGGKAYAGNSEGEDGKCANATQHDGSSIMNGSRGNQAA